MSEDKKIDLNNLSDEELVLLAKVKVETKPNRTVSVAHRFILDLNIVEGDARVPAGIIYERYKEWSKEPKILPRAIFFKDFSKFFAPRKQTSYRYYLLDPAPFDLSEEGFKKYEEGLKKERAKKEKEFYKKWREKKETT